MLFFWREKKILIWIKKKKKHDYEYDYENIKIFLVSYGSYQQKKKYENKSRKKSCQFI